MDIGVIVNISLNIEDYGEISLVDLFVYGVKEVGRISAKEGRSREDLWTYLRLFYAPSKPLGSLLQGTSSHRQGLVFQHRRQGDV